MSQMDAHTCLVHDQNIPQKNSSALSTHISQIMSKRQIHRKQLHSHKVSKKTNRPKKAWHTTPRGGGRNRVILKRTKLNILIGGYRFKYLFRWTIGTPHTHKNHIITHLSYKRASLTVQLCKMAKDIITSLNHLTE